MPLRLHDFDLQIVRYCAGGSQTGVGRMLAVGVSKLGNGWLYPPLALLLVIAFGARAAERALNSIEDAIPDLSPASRETEPVEAVEAKSE